MSRPRSADLVELGDLDELVRHIDRLVDGRDWSGLVELRDLCRAALERGKQLWPAASLAEYRLALDAPAAVAASVIVPGAGHLALGPLPEVAASTHTWGELAGSVPDGPLVTITAHERVVRGDDLRHDERVDRRVVDLPPVLQPWEPDYALAEYLAAEARFLPHRDPSSDRSTSPSPGSASTIPMRVPRSSRSPGRGRPSPTGGPRSWPSRATPWPRWPRSGRPGPGRRR